MAIFYAEEHINCECYSGGESPIIEISEINKTCKKDFYWQSHSIFMLIAGKGIVRTRTIGFKTLSEGMFFFAPKNCSSTFEAEENSKILIFHLGKHMYLCQSFHIESLFEEVSNIKQPVYSEKITLLEMNKNLWDFVNPLINLLEDQLKCINFLNNKIDELLILLRAYYSKEDLSEFFNHIRNPHSVFMEYVRRNWSKYKNIEELANGISMSPQYFSKKFKEIFNKPPGVWMQEERARVILQEIRTTDKTFLQISEENGFAAQSHFNRFCKKC